VPVAGRVRAVRHRRQAHRQPARERQAQQREQRPLTFLVAAVAAVRPVPVPAAVAAFPAAAGVAR